jgi:hypothetical protein
MSYQHPAGTTVLNWSGLEEMEQLLHPEVSHSQGEEEGAMEHDCLQNKEFK